MAVPLRGQAPVVIAATLLFVAAYLAFWDDHAAVLRIRNLKAEEGDRRLIGPHSVQCGTLTAAARVHFMAAAASFGARWRGSLRGDGHDVPGTCPLCGATTPPDQERCVSCGFALAGVDGVRYVVDAAKCRNSLACMPRCPTGAIDNWRTVPQAEQYAVADQLGWSTLPAARAIESPPIETITVAVPLPAASPVLAAGDAAVRAAGRPLLLRGLPAAQGRRAGTPAGRRRRRGSPGSPRKSPGRLQRETFADPPDNGSPSPILRRKKTGRKTLMTLPFCAPRSSGLPRIRWKWGARES